MTPEIEKRAKDYTENSLPVPLPELIVQITYLASHGLGPLNEPYSKDQVDNLRYSMVDVAANATADLMRLMGMSFVSLQEYIKPLVAKRKQSWNGKHKNRPEAWFAAVISAATWSYYTENRQHCMIDILITALDAIASIDAQRALHGHCFYEV
jgi:hypothetical protein